MNVTDLLFQPLQDQHVSLEVDFLTLHHALLVNVAFVAQKMVGMHFPTHGSVFDFFLWQKWGDNIQVTGFLFPGAPNTPHL